MGEDEIQVFGFEQGTMRIMGAARRYSKAAVEIFTEFRQIGIASFHVEMPRNRNSLTSRSCKVWLARSTRPLACGVLAQMIWMSNSCMARPNWVNPLVQPEGLLLVDPEDPMLVTVEGHRFAIPLEIVPRASQ